MNREAAALGVTFVALLLGAERADPDRGPPVAAVAVRGTVYDSIARRPLAGATVQFSGAGDTVAGRTYSATSDSAGRFEMREVIPGAYVAGFFHPALDSLGFTTGTRSVVVGRADVGVTLSTPSVRTIARALCPDGTFGDSLGMLVGFVRATGTSTLLAGATVTAGWGETVIQRNSIRQREPEITTTTDSSGWYGMCALPIDAPLMVRAASGAESSGYVEVTLGQSGLRQQAFHVGGAHPVRLEIADSSGRGADQPLVGLRSGAARASGVVTDSDGAPVTSAQVRVWETSAQDTTSDRGAFLLDGLPGGTHTLEVRAIGFTPVRRVLHLDPDQALTVQVTLSERIVTLPGVTVRGELVYFSQLADFERRRRGPTGHFLTSTDIDRRASGASAVTLLQGMPGVDVVFAPKVGYIAIMKGHQGAPCTPLMYVDGRKAYLSAAEIGNLYATADIAAVEVYPRLALVPLEFQEIAPSCGVVVLWTRPPSARVKERR